MRTLAAVLAVAASLTGGAGGPDKVRPTSDRVRPALLAANAQSTQNASSEVQKIVSTYCITCHNDRLKTGGLALDRPELSNVGAHADVWEKVIRKVRTGMMPPAGVPRPSAAERDHLLSSLSGTLDEAARSLLDASDTAAAKALDGAQEAVKTTLGVASDGANDAPDTSPRAQRLEKARAFASAAMDLVPAFDAGDRLREPIGKAVVAIPVR